MDRREFVAGGVASMMAAFLGISPPEVEALMKEAEENPDDALVFIMDGTRYKPEITVQGVIKAIDFDMKYIRIPEDPIFTVRFHGPFTMKFVDEEKFWGR